MNSRAYISIGAIAAVGIVSGLWWTAADLIALAPPLRRGRGRFKKMQEPSPVISGWTANRRHSLVSGWLLRSLLKTPRW